MPITKLPRLSNEIATKFSKVGETALRRVVKSNPKDMIVVEIGDTKQSDFKPQVKINRWGTSEDTNEVNFSLRAQEHPSAEVRTEGKLIRYITPEYEVHQYELDPSEDIGEDGGLEFEWVLPQKPSSNVLTATIQTKGLKFYYQPELTQEEIDRGARRPENVVGSYAVYHESKGGLNRADGMDYKAGKAFHIYRPKVKDRSGNETWGELHIDEKNGLLTVTVNQDFLDNAVYPVVVDPTFGYVAAGSSTYDVCYESGGSKTNGRNGLVVSIGEAGTLLKVSASMGGSAGFNAKGLVNTKNSGGAGSHGEVDKSSGVAIGTSKAWNDFTLNSSSISATDYVINVTGDASGFGSFSDDHGYIYYDSISSDYVQEDNVNYSTPEDPWTSAIFTFAIRFSIYAEYTPSVTDYPILLSTTATQFATSVTSMPVNMPSDLAAGDLLIAAVEVRNSGSWTPPTGWTEFDSQIGGASVGELTLFYEISDASEGSTQTFTASTGTTAIWQVFRIVNWHGTTPPEADTASGDVSAANPPSLTPSWGSENTLWLAIAGHTAATSTAFSAGPSGYEGFTSNGASSGGSAVSIASAWDMVAAASEDPGAFTVDGSNRYWTAATIAIRPPDARFWSLVIGGGGGGGGDGTATQGGGGGGGAGGYLENTALGLLADTEYTITVGAGGSGGNGSNNGVNGGNSSIGSVLTSTGGGGGGYAQNTGSSGGSGGGGGGDDGSSGGSGTSGQGYDGGDGGNDGGAGGGGAGGAGANVSDDTGSVGGVGRASTISGSLVYRAGGGGGGAGNGAGSILGGAGGNGGGGDGGDEVDPGSNATANTGSGGGGAGYSGGNGGDGSNGVVIIRFETDSISVVTKTNATETTDGSDTILTWTTSGAFEFTTAQTATIEQEGFAFGDDDGNESSHTLDTQDTNVTEPVGTKTLRVLLDSTNDYASSAFKLKYQKNGSGGYSDVPTSSGSSGYQDGLSTFLSTWTGVHTAYSFNNTAANTGTDSTASANSSSYAQAETGVFPNYGTDSACAPDANSDLDIYTITDSAMMLYIPSNLATGVYGLFFNGGGTNAQGAFIRSQSNGSTIELGISHNASGTNQDYTSYTITERGWVCVGFQFEDNSGNMAIWVNGVNVEEVARTYGLLYGSGNPYIGDNNGDDYPGWGAESTINGSGILIANFVADNPNSTNSSPPGAGDSFYTDYFDAHDNTSTNEIYISTSSNVASGGEATTARLTAPSGKTTGDFTTGRRWDDENGSDSIDIAADNYTELEWVLTTQSPADTDDYYEFRVYNGDDPLDTYTVTPRWTIGTGGGGEVVKDMIGGFIPFPR